MWWTWDPKKSWYELYLSQTTEKAMKELVALLHPMGVHHQAYVKNGVLHFHAYLSREEMETVTDTFPRRFWKNIFIACEFPLDALDYGVLVGDCLAY